MLETDIIRELRQKFESNLMAANKVSCITSTTGECLRDIKIIFNNK